MDNPHGAVFEVNAHTGELVSIDAKQYVRFANIENHEGMRTVQGAGPSFTLIFSDVLDQTGIGFDDQDLGSIRRNTLIRVAEDISDQLPNHSGTSTLIVNSSVNDPDSEFLAFTFSRFFCEGGYATPAALRSITGQVSFPPEMGGDGNLTVNFGLEIQDDPTQPVGGEAFDLYYVLLHELTHFLGFISVLADSTDNLTTATLCDSNGTNVGTVSAFDGLLRNGDGNAVFVLNAEGGVVPNVAMIFNPFLQLPDFNQPQTPISMFSVGGTGGLAHWDQELTMSGRPAIMTPKLFPGRVDLRSWIPQEVATLQAIGFDVLPRMNLTAEDITGIWFDPILDGSGFTFFAADSGIVVLFFGYLNGVQRWLISEVIPLNQFAPDTIVETTLLIGDSGQLNAPQPSSELSTFGSLRFSLFDCISGAASIEGEGEFTGTIQSFDLQRILISSNTACE